MDNPRERRSSFSTILQRAQEAIGDVTRDQTNRAHGTASPTLTAMIESFIDSLPVLSLTSLSEDNRNCPICVDNFQGDDVPVRLSCSHVMGRDCLKQWLGSSVLNANNNTCPTCRTVLIERPLRSAVGRTFEIDVMGFRPDAGPELAPWLPDSASPVIRRELEDLRARVEGYLRAQEHDRVPGEYRRIRALLTAMTARVDGEPSLEARRLRYRLDQAFFNSDLDVLRAENRHSGQAEQDTAETREESVRRRLRTHLAEVENMLQTYSDGWRRPELLEDHEINREITLIDRGRALEREHAEEVENVSPRDPLVTQLQRQNEDTIVLRGHLREASESRRAEVGNETFRDQGRHTPFPRLGALRPFSSTPETQANLPDGPRTTHPRHHRVVREMEDQMRAAVESVGRSNQMNPTLQSPLATSEARTDHSTRRMNANEISAQADAIRAEAEEREWRSFQQMERLNRLLDPQQHSMPTAEVRIDRPDRSTGLNGRGPQGEELHPETGRRERSAAPSHNRIDPTLRFTIPRLEARSNFPGRPTDLNGRPTHMEQPVHGPEQQARPTGYWPSPWNPENPENGFTIPRLGASVWNSTRNRGPPHQAGSPSTAATQQHARPATPQPNLTVPPPRRDPQPRSHRLAAIDHALTRLDATLTRMEIEHARLARELTVLDTEIEELRLTQEGARTQMNERMERMVDAEARLDSLRMSLGRTSGVQRSRAALRRARELTGQRL